MKQVGLMNIQAIFFLVAAQTPVKLECLTSSRHSVLLKRNTHLPTQQSKFVYI